MENAGRHIRSKTGIYFWVKSLLCGVFLCGQFFSYGQVDVPQKNTGFMDFNVYRDSRDFQNITINLLANLPNKIQYFSLNNFQSPNNKKDLG
ncbi:MAG: hypothetical protein ACI9YL_002275, partial [Luteibaculaceae bacterium]